MTVEDDRRELERLRSQQHADDAKRWDALFLGQRQALESLTRIETRCAVCQKTIEEHQVLLIGDPHAGTSGLASSVKASQTALFGSASAPGTGLVQDVEQIDKKVDRINGRVGLMWKGVGIAVAAAFSAVVKTFWKGA